MEFGLNEIHTAEIVNFLRFSRYQRAHRLKGIDIAFQDLIESRLAEDDTFTEMEVRDMLEGLQSVVRSDIESELIHSAHTNTLLLRQLFLQGEKWHLTLQADISELENRALLDEIKEFEEKQLTMQGSDKLTSPPPPPKPKLAPLNDLGMSRLLEKELEDVKSENDTLKSKVKSLESSFNSVSKESVGYKRELEETMDKLQKLKLENSTKQLEQQNLPEAVNQQVATQEVTEHSDAIDKELSESKHEILKLRAELVNVNKEMEKKFQETSQFQNLKKMLGTKNEQIKDLRAKLSQFEPHPE